MWAKDVADIVNRIAGAKAELTIVKPVPANSCFATPQVIHWNVAVRTVLLTIPASTFTLLTPQTTAIGVAQTLVAQASMATDPSRRLRQSHLSPSNVLVAR